MLVQFKYDFISIVSVARDKITARTTAALKEYTDKTRTITILTERRKKEMMDFCKKKRCPVFVCLTCVTLHITYLHHRYIYCRSGI